jgi:general secretion pathway protein D
MVEVTLTESTQFGLEFSGVGSHGNTQAVFGTNYSNNTHGGSVLNPFTTDVNGKSSFRTGSNRQDGFTLGLADKNDPQKQFGYIRAQAGNGQVKVISSPQLLVSSHTEARIQVGQKVPVVTGSVTSSDGGTTETTEQTDTGVILEVTPYVTSTDLISLDIKQQMSQAIANTLTPNSNSPIISVREIATSMTISNGQTMVLGGLIQERTNDQLDSLPFLNRIPFVRRLFGSTNTSVERTEVLVLITGHIVNEHSAVDELIRRYNDAVEALNEYDASLGDRPAGSRSPSLEGDSLQ